MEDLTAASHDDVVEFFQTYYAPNNASLVVAGDIDLDRTQALVEKWFSEIPRGPEVMPVAPPAARLGGRRAADAARSRAPAAVVSRVADAAAVCARRRGARRAGRRAGRRQELAALQAARLRHADGAGRHGVSRVRCARQLVPHHRDGTAGPTAAELTRAIDEEIARLQREPPTAREVERALNQIEASFYRRMERVGGFGGKADQLNEYFAAGGGPDFFAEDLARYTALTRPTCRRPLASGCPASGASSSSVEPEVAP